VVEAPQSDRALYPPTVENLIGLPFMVIGLCLLLANRQVSEAMVRGNRASLPGHFQGHGWVTWSRFINYTVGGLFLVLGTALLLGLIN